MYVIKLLLLTVLVCAVPSWVQSAPNRPVPGPVSAQVLEVVDGDTFKAIANPWPSIYVDISIRINGIDTPEKGGSAKCDAERLLAEEAKKVLVGLLFKRGEQVWLKNIQYGKFAGRVLADVFVGDLDVIAYMKSHKVGGKHIAHEYDGGARKSWCP
jgi:micrococcal nuclease